MRPTSSASAPHRQRQHSLHISRCCRGGRRVSWRPFTLRPCAPLHASDSPEVPASLVPDEDAEALLRAGYDPEGLFRNAAPLAEGQSLFARRAAARSQTQTQEQQQQQQQQQQPKPQPQAQHPSRAQPSQSASSTQASSAHAPAPSTAPGSSAPHEGGAHSQAQARSWSYPICPLRNAPAPGTPEAAAFRGVPAAQDCPEAGYMRKDMEELLATRFIALDLDFPGLRVLHIDPPVFAADGFATPAACEAFIAAAAASGEMQASKIGAGNAGSNADNEYNSRRTSTSLLLTPEVLARFPDLAHGVQGFQQGGQTLIAVDKRQWGRPGRMPAPSQLTYESAQTARYQTGQHFLAHEDAFPLGLARNNGFQRRATLLLYLNTVAQGGSTRFEHLGPLSVRPEQGKALLFFPGYADGRPDERTLHTAEDAVEGCEKWVMQQWVAGGVAPHATPQPLTLPSQLAKQGAAAGPAAIESVNARTTTISIPVSSVTSAGSKAQAEKKKGRAAGGSGRKGF